MRVQLVEPDEELQLEPLPPVFARSNKPSSSKSAKDKDSKKQRNRKRTWLDALVENIAVQITALHLSIQPRARVCAGAAGGEPVLPSPLAVTVDQFAFSLADEHFRAVSHKDVSKLLARSKSNRILTLRKLLTVNSVRVGVPRADPNALDALKLPAVRVEVEMKRHTSTGVVFALVASASVGTLSASFERAEYGQFMASLEGLLWSMRRQTEDEADAIAAEAAAKPTRHVSRPHHSGGAAAAGAAAGDDESPAELLERLDNIGLSDDEDEDAANGGEAAPSRRDSKTASLLPLEAGGELSAVSVALKVGGFELTLTDAPNRRGYTLAMRELALQLSSTVARAADNLNSERNVTVSFSIAAFQSHDLRGISLIAQQQPSRRDGLGDVTYEYEFADGASDNFEGSDDDDAIEGGDDDDDDPDAAFRRHSHASSASSLGSMPRRHSDIEVPKPDLVRAKLSVTFIDGAPFSAPMSIELSVRTSPLRFFLERRLLMHLFDFVLSALPALPPTKPTVITDFAMLRPERLLIAVHIGVFTIYVPAPIGAPLTHDVRAVIGPIRLRSPTVPGDSLHVRGFVEAGVFLVPVPPNGRAESDSIRAPPHQASMFARDGELPIVHPTVFDIAIEVRNFVRTIEMLVNAAPPTLSIMPATQLVEVSVQAGLAVDLSDAALASLVQGWMPVLKILDDSKEIRNRIVLRQRRRAERVKRLLAEHTEDVQRRTSKDLNNGDAPKKKKKSKDHKEASGSGAAAAPVAVAAAAPAAAPAEQKKRAATDGVPPALVSLANARVAWRLRVRLVPQQRGEAPILLVRGRDGLPLSLLDIFEDWSLEKWSQTASPTTLLSLRPAAIHFDLQHVALGALGARVHLEQLRLDLNQPLMVCPLSIHIVPAVARERGADIAAPASEADAEHAPLPELEELLTGLEIKYDFHVPRKARDYPHEAHARLLGQHVRICEHGPLGIKPLKNMVKQFYWRTIRGLEMAPKPVEITTFPIWMHVDAQLSDCSMELMRNAQLKEVISRDIFQLSVHPADRKLLVQRTDALERRTRRALAQVGVADKRAADAAADALEANITLAAVKMQLFEMQAEYEAEKKRAYDAVKAAEAAQSEAAAVAGTYREVMSLLNTEQSETDTAVTVQRLANEKIMLRNELEACESERAHLERQVEQLQEQIARLTGNTVLAAPPAPMSSAKSARSPSPSPKTPKRVASTASHVSAASAPATNMRASADDSSGESDSAASAATTTTPTRGSLLSRVRSKLANSLPVVELSNRGSPTSVGVASAPGVRGGKDVFLAAPITVHVGEEIAVTFAFGSFESNKYDWFGLYSRAETDPKRYVSFQWKRGAAGRAAFKAPVQTGVYEIRCFRGKSRKQYYSAIAISNFVNVLHAVATNAGATSEGTK